jgi:2-dehydro-3-deoxyglucarate aldolase/4-hydroxy-2-oxoheptanedioate aldolase
MENTSRFREKMQGGQVCLGTVISFTEPAVTEALCHDLDFVWIDMEHGALTVETVQSHVMATKGSPAAPLVRVPWNDPVLIKPVLDLGAAGIIVPLVRTADEARRAVAACLYPPEGIRGFGPRRPSNYGRLGGPAFCRKLNQEVMPILQIEHIDAVNSIEDILAVPGVASLVIGPNDLSGSMGHMGEPRHPDVVRAIETVIQKARRANMFVGIGIGNDPDLTIDWLNKGMNWVAMGSDFGLMLRALDEVGGKVRSYLDRTQGMRGATSKKASPK